MERLIIEFGVGDGYTYSADLTFPIIYESKDKALHDFELLLIEKIDLSSQLQTQLYQHYEENTKILKELQRVSSDRRTSDKDKEKLNQKFYKELQDLRNNKMNPLDLQIKEAQNISFGGQQFELSTFTYQRESDKQMDYTLPTIFTLDEYYHSLEQTLNQQKKLKP